MLWKIERESSNNKKGKQGESGEEIQSNSRPKFLFTALLPFPPFPFFPQRHFSVVQRVVAFSQIFLVYGQGYGVSMAL
jgi:hypothetical protein